VGITVRHRAACGSTRGARCNCSPGFRARVRVGQQQHTKTFSSIAAARAWQADTEAAKWKGLLAPLPLGDTTIRAAAASFLEAAYAGRARTRSGSRYRLNVVQQYEALFRNYLLPTLGSKTLAGLRRQDVQALVDDLLARDLAGSTVRNAIKPLQVIYRRALRDEIVHKSPCDHLELPQATSRRERVASPAEARQLLAALRADDVALWGCALYAGLRQGEIMGLRWSDIDCEHGLIHVRRSIDRRNRIEQKPKTRAGERRLPLARELRRLLEEHREITKRSAGLIFGVTPDTPFTDSAVRKRAHVAWRDAGLTPIGLHECRHTYASLLIAAGVNAKAISTYMGHASIETTFDLYGKLLPGNEAESGALLDRILQV
jgi:integrase